MTTLQDHIEKHRKEIERAVQTELVNMKRTNEPDSWLQIRGCAVQISKDEWETGAPEYYKAVAYPIRPGEGVGSWVLIGDYR
jgi:hypothetical protein